MDYVEAEELKKMCSEINCFSRDQICDGEIACPFTKVDEMGCDLDGGDMNDEYASNPGPNPEP